MSEDEAETMLRRLKALRSDPFLHYLDAAPIDDEPVTAEEEAAIAEVEADRAAPRVPFDEVKRKHE